MIRSISKLAVVGLLVLGVSCSSFSWRGNGGDVDSDAAAKGIKSVDELARNYENQRYWGFWQGVMGAHAQAFNDGLHNFHMSFNRSFLNHRNGTSSGRYTYDSYKVGTSSNANYDASTGR
jgi:hypothetical protein